MCFQKISKKLTGLRHPTQRIVKIVALGLILSISLPFLPLAEVLSRSAAAQAAATDGGGKARLNLAASLTIKSQSMSAAACIIDLGFDAEYERDVLVESRDKFIHMLNALEFGELALGVPTPENNSKAIRAIRAVHEAWTPFVAAVDDVLAGNNTTEAVKIIIETNGELLAKTDFLVSAIQASYANPNEVMLNDAIAINIAERQMVLSQKMLLEACKIEGNYFGPEAIERFRETISIYENSLIALRDGMPMVGVNPPPNEEIKYQLELAWEDWLRAKPALEKIHENSGNAKEEILHVRDVMEELDIRLHTIVVEYLLSTPGSADIYKIPMLAYLNNTLLAWTEDPVVINAVKAANIENQNLSESDMEALELRWEEEVAAGIGPLSDKIEQNPASAFLREQQSATNGIVTEVFVMDKRGLNVAASEVTAEYWHAEDERYALTIGNRSGDIHISEVHIEEGEHFYQIQTSVPILDPDTDELIGVMTFGINIQSMF